MATATAPSLALRTVAAHLSKLQAVATRNLPKVAPNMPVAKPATEIATQN